MPLPRYRERRIRRANIQVQPKDLVSHHLRMISGIQPKQDDFENVVWMDKGEVRSMNPKPPITHLRPHINQAGFSERRSNLDRRKKLGTSPTGHERRALD